jgi:hypothetical protein
MHFKAMVQADEPTLEQPAILELRSMAGRGCTFARRREQSMGKTIPDFLSSE